MDNPHFSVGMTFGQKSEFKEAIINYAFKQGKDIKIEKNDKVRCIAKCKQSGCPWSITLRCIKDVNCWRVTTFTDTHDGCSWVWENPTVKASRLANRWKKDIRGNSKWTVREFRERVATDDHFHITSKVAYKAMTMARASINGELEDYFKKFWNYYLEIQRSNPNTTSIVKMSESVEEGGKKRFLRWYICWEACRNGFQHCRKIIGVDGCHLRSKYGGYLLTATAMDPNDGIFPIAYAMVEGENKESWSWFLALLKHDLGIDVADENEVTFISDKQKGLIPAFNVVIPNVVHRFCVRHLYANLKVAGFHGKAIKETLWAAARSTTVNSFKDEMRKMKDLDINAFDWLGNKHPSEWSRSHFTCSALCDILVNNVSECFNAMIVKAREAPLISCLEMLRTILMTRLFKNRQEASEWTGLICPNIVKKIAVEEKFAGGYIPLQCDLNLFEVKKCHTGEQHQVDLGKKTCSCRKWDLTGIPCRHAICAIWMKRHTVFDYVHSCYTVEAYLKVYGCSIKPMAGPNEWPQTHREAPLPPEYKAKPGRPRKLRMRGADETKEKNQITNDGVHMSRKHVVLHCTLCKQRGHNSRKCPLKPRNPQPQRKRTQAIPTPLEELGTPFAHMVDVPIQEVPSEVTATNLNVEVEALHNVEVETLHNEVIESVEEDILLPAEEDILLPAQEEIPLPTQEEIALPTQPHFEDDEGHNSSEQGHAVHTQEEIAPFAAPPPPRRPKTLGLTKKKKLVAQGVKRKYRTRSSMKFKGNSGNPNQPIEID